VLDASLMRYDSVTRVLLWLGLAAVSVAPPVLKQMDTTAVSPAAAPPAALRPGDLIRLRIWREPDFSGDFTVDEAGVVVLPRLGALDVTSEPPESLKATLVRGFGAFLNHSSIEVTFLRRVQIAGAVQKPGLYHVDPLMTVGDALALAGGVLPGGRPDEVEIIREGEKLPETLAGRLLIGESPIRSGDQLYVTERGWISRNPGLIVGMISAVSTLVLVVR